MPTNLPPQYFEIEKKLKTASSTKEKNIDFFHKLKFVRIWGKNKFSGQKVNRNYILQDEDLIELHI